MAGVALPLVELRHERQRLAVQRRDLLGRGLVDRVVVGRHQRLVVEEADLVLAEVALALRALDDHAGGVHRVADVAQQRLHPRRTQDGVVDVVLVARGEAAVAGVPGALVGVVEHDELELGAGQRDVPEVGGAGELLLEDRARRRLDRRVVGEHQVALDQHGRGQVRQPAGSCRSRGRTPCPRSPSPTRSSRSRRRCSCRRRRPAGSCSPRRPARPRRPGSTTRAAACPAGGPACR